MIVTDETPTPQAPKRRGRQQRAAEASVQEAVSATPVTADTAPAATPVTAAPPAEALEEDPEAAFARAWLEERLQRDPLATAWTEFDLRCPPCQIIHYVPFCLFVNAQESPGLVQRIINSQFNLKRCPLCHKTEYYEHPYTFYDPVRKLAVQVRPEWEWHAGGGEEWYAARLEDFFEQWAEHDVRIEVVFGPDQLIERFLHDWQPPRDTAVSAGSADTPAATTQS